MKTSEDYRKAVNSSWLSSFLNSLRLFMDVYWLWRINNLWGPGMMSLLKYLIWLCTDVISARYFCQKFRTIFNNPLTSSPVCLMELVLAWKRKMKNTVLTDLALRLWAITVVQCMHYPANCIYDHNRCIYKKHCAGDASEILFGMIYLSKHTQRSPVC